MKCAHRFSTFDSIQFPGLISGRTGGATDFSNTGGAHGRLQSFIFGFHNGVVATATGKGAVVGPGGGMGFVPGATIGVGAVGMTMGVGAVGGVKGNGGSIGGKPTRRGCSSSDPSSGTHLGRGKMGSTRTWVSPMRWANNLVFPVDNRLAPAISLALRTAA